MQNDLSQDEREFLCLAYEQAKDHPQHQVINDPILSRMWTEKFSQARRTLHERGFVDRGGDLGPGQETGGFWLTRAGMREAERICWPP